MTQPDRSGSDDAQQSKLPVLTKRGKKGVLGIVALVVIGNIIGTPGRDGSRAEVKTPEPGPAADPDTGDGRHLCTAEEITKKFMAGQIDQPNGCKLPDQLDYALAAAVKMAVRPMIQMCQVDRMNPQKHATNCDDLAEMKTLGTPLVAAAILELDENAKRCLFNGGGALDAPKRRAW
jgi:hypothetical protein